MGKIRIVSIICVWLFVFIFLIKISNNYAYTDDAAMVMNLSGRAVYQSGNREEQPVRMADFFYPGDRIHLDPGAAIVLIYSAGGVREEITGPGTIRVGTNESEIEEKTIRIKRTEADYLPDGSVIRAGVKYAAVSLRGADKASRQLDTLCDTVIRSLAPVFRWQNVDGAETYRLNVFDKEDKKIFETFTKKKRFYVERQNGSELRRRLSVDGGSPFWEKSAFRSGRGIFCFGKKTNRRFGKIGKKSYIEISG